MLYRISEPNDTEMSHITLFPGFAPYVTDDFRRMLTMDVRDDSAPFKDTFLGYMSRTKVAFICPRLNTKLE